MTLMLAAAAETGPDQATQIAAAAGALGAVGATYGGLAARFERRRSTAEAEVAARMMAERKGKLEEVYYGTLARADNRASWAFGAALGSGILTAVTVSVGGYLSLRYGTPVDAIIPGAGGLMSGGMTAYFGRLAKASREDRKEMFDKLAESWEKDRDADRKIRIAQEIESHAQEAAFDTGRAAGAKAGEEVDLEGLLGASEEAVKPRFAALGHQSDLAKDVDRSMPWNGEDAEKQMRLELIARLAELEAKIRDMPQAAPEPPRRA